MPSRATKESTTSSGLRRGTTTSGETSALSRTSNQKRVNRQLRGSFSTKSGDVPNSSFRTVEARCMKSSTTGESYHAGLYSCQSSQLLPAECRTASFNAMMALDSQWPLGLDGASGINVFGRSHPSKFNIRATALVPDLCIPRTTIVLRCIKLLSSCLLTFHHQITNFRKIAISPKQHPKRCHQPNSLHHLCCNAVYWSIASPTVESLSEMGPDQVQIPVI